MASRLCCVSSASAWFRLDCSQVCDAVCRTLDHPAVTYQRRMARVSAYFASICALKSSITDSQEPYADLQEASMQNDKAARNQVASNKNLGVLLSGEAESDQQSAKYFDYCCKYSKTWTLLHVTQKQGCFDLVSAMESWLKQTGNKHKQASPSDRNTRPVARHGPSLQSAGSFPHGRRCKQILSDSLVQETVDGCEIRSHHLRNHGGNHNVGWYLQGNHQKPGFLRWCELDIATIHSRYPKWVALVNGNVDNLRFPSG